MEDSEAMAGIPSLEGRRLTCHCRAGSHAMLMSWSGPLALIRTLRSKPCQPHPAGDEQALASAAGRVAALPQSRIGRATLERQRPKQKAGR